LLLTFTKCIEQLEGISPTIAKDEASQKQKIFYYTFEELLKRDSIEKGFSEITTENLHHFGRSLFNF
jgi:hypothetical protein